MAQTLACTLFAALVASAWLTACGSQPTEAKEAPPTPLTPPAVAVHPCQVIEDTPYRELPRRVAGNQFDPSGVVVVGDTAWLINDREGRENVPDGGTGVYRLDLDSGGVEHVPVPGFDRVSRKFEGLAWDGREMHAIGNVGNREANTFLVSFAVDPQTQQMTGTARYHDLAAALGEATGHGREPWKHGIKIEALAALDQGELLIGLRRMGDDGEARRAYRAILPAAGDPDQRLQLQPLAAFDDADLGTAVGGEGGAWVMQRELAGLSEPACDVVMVVASAEFEQGDTWEFLSNSLLSWRPDSDSVERLCTFDEGLKVEGVALVTRPDTAGSHALVLLYDNDSAAAGGFKVVEGFEMACLRR